MNGRAVAKFYSKLGTFNLVVENFFFLDFNSSSSPIANSRAAARLQCAVPPAIPAFPMRQALNVRLSHASISILSTLRPEIMSPLFRQLKQGFRFCQLNISPMLGASLWLVGS
jgi:hypothetical protein